MRRPVSREDVEELEFSTPDHGSIAQQLIEWAEHPRPDDELSPRELLTRAGEQLELAADGDGALALYHRAVATDGDATLDPRAHLVTLLLDRGERDEADRWDRELRRSGPTGSATYEYMGDVWGEHGEDRRALGWLTRGVLRHEQGPGFSEMGLAQLCLARWRLRERLGHEPDDYDFIGIGLLRRLAQRAQEHGLKE